MFLSGSGAFSLSSAALKAGSGLADARTSSAVNQDLSVAAVDIFNRMGTSMVLKSRTGRRHSLRGVIQFVVFPFPHIALG